VSSALRALRDVRLPDVGEVGGKAASLGELLAEGVRVPDGVVVTTDAGALTEEDWRSLLAAAAQLGGGPFAVRSSGIAEDGAMQSYAGMYESELGVAVADLPAAADRILASTRAARVADYRGGGNGHAGVDGRMAVIVQRMVDPVAAGVALTADPLTGDRQSCIVTAVRGTGDRLVSGAAVGDEWVVGDSSATSRRQPERAIDRRQATEIARAARRIEAARGAPQDVEWAIDRDGALWILQARPMTALPPDVSWEAPAPGAYTRQLRFGEWISEPVTPLFESWLLSMMEERLHVILRAGLGQRAPRPHHVLVNGWYFYSLNWASPGSMLRSLPDIIRHVIQDPRRSAGALPPTVRHSVPVFERDWRADLQPRYRAVVARADARVESIPVDELPGLIDELADLAGEYFTSIAALSGAAYKMEMNLARFYRRHLGKDPGGSHLPLVTGFEAPTNPAQHAVASLDWWHAPAAPGATATTSRADHGRLIQARHDAEAAAFRALESSPGRLRAFRRLLAETQHLVPLREEQVAELTIAWPAMRRAVVRIGDALAAGGVIAAADDVFFLTRDEALGSLRAISADGEAPEGGSIEVASRRAKRAEQARLVPPLLVGHLNRGLKALFDAYPKLLGAAHSDTALVSGTPASPGRATGAVRVVRGPQDFENFQPGEILVAPMTAPAWTPLFTKAAGVVTDVGSAAAHASIIAREYGIPAVVGCGDATARLRTGIRVTVDGGAGNVEPADLPSAGLGGGARGDVA
jgi:phosphohistidine swiveling domain-containing protein